MKRDLFVGLVMVIGTGWAYLGAWNGLTSGDLWQQVLGALYALVALGYTILIGWAFRQAEIRSRELHR